MTGYKKDTGKDATLDIQKKLVDILIKMGIQITN